MTKNFNDILDGSVKFGDSQRVCFKKGFEAGQKSKQAGVDELQKRIGDAIYDLQHIESAMWEEQVEHVLRILKGNINDH